MEHLLKAIGSIPKAFSLSFLALMLMLLGVFTFSVSKTILFECGSLNLTAATSIGGHCKYLSITSHWHFVPVDFVASAAAQEQESGGEAGQIGGTSRDTTWENQCSQVIQAAMTDKKLKTYETSGNLSDQINEKHFFMGRWYKGIHSKKPQELYDIMFYCRKDGISVAVSGSEAWPIRRYAREARNRVLEVLDTR